MTALQTAPARTAATETGTGTRALLATAAVSFPVWATVSLIQAFTRQDFVVTRNPLSALSNGSLGWIQITNFLLCGVLLAVGASGLRRALAGQAGGTWTPRLVRIAGIGMFAAGIFRMDPGDGFPAGTPAGPPPAMSWHSDLHMLSGTTAFAAVIAACFVLGRHYARSGQPASAIVSRVAGVIFILGDLWAMTGAKDGALTMLIGVFTGFLWVCLVAARLYRKTAR
jgi:hypothetical protein